MFLNIRTIQINGQYLNVQILKQRRDEIAFTIKK